MAAQYYLDGTPDAVKNDKGLHLLTMNTPNGQAVQIFLEELADVYGTKWNTTLINIGTNEQKKDWFLKLDPNGRIPVIIDNTTTPPHSVHETSAELFYLAKYDTNHTFTFSDPLEHSQALQWTFFYHGSGAPYQGNLGYFKRQSEHQPSAIKRFRDETYRIFGVLELHLSGKLTGEPKEYLAGNGKGKYSVADIKAWPWVKNWERGGFTKEEMDFPHLLKWIERIGERPAVQRGTGDKYVEKK